MLPRFKLAYCTKPHTVSSRDELQIIALLVLFDHPLEKNLQVTVVEGSAVLRLWKLIAIIFDVMLAHTKASETDQGEGEDL